MSPGSFNKYRHKFGVLSFSYAPYSHFRGSLESGQNYTVNLGDYIQSIGTHRALEALGVSGSDIIYVDRDRLGEYNGEPVNLIMNGMFTPSNFPMSKKINPVFFGFSYHPDNIIPADDKVLFEDSITYFLGRKIGCRDRSTAECLLAYGLDAYVTGCLSQSFETTHSTVRDLLPVLICGIDDPKVEEWLMLSFPNHIRLKDQRRPAVTHPLSPLDIEDCRRSANALISLYRDHVSLVFTSLMHCASPCASLGIPTVVIRQDPDNLRFSDLKEHLPVLASGRVMQEFKTQDLGRVAATLNRRSAMLDMLADVVAGAAI